MKKTLIALAAVAVSSAAFAQVTISGRLDMGMTRATTTNTLEDAVTKTTVRDTTGAQNTRTTSRITFAGSEAIAPGLNAAFNFETGLNPSDDAGLFAGSTRHGSISLISAKLGTFSIGTFSSNGLDAVRGFSVATVGVAGGDFMARAAGSNQLNGLNVVMGAPGTDPAIGMAGRSRNAVSYVTPVMNGFQASLGMNVQNNVTANQDVNGRIIGLSYVSGPLAVRAALGSGTLDHTVTGLRLGEQNNNNIGVSYDFGVAAPYFIYENAKASGADRDDFVKIASTEIGVRAPMGAFTPYLSYSSGKHKADGIGTFAKSTGYQFGSIYTLSKRTYAYFSMGQDNTKTAGELDEAVNASNKRNGYAAGLVHSF